MNYLFIKYSYATVLMAICNIGPTFSQFLISSAGNTFKNNDITIEWSLGEIAVFSLEKDDIIVTQGFHQDLSFTTYVLQNETGPQSLIYPNPVSDILLLQLDHPEALSFTIYNSLGIPFLNGNLEEKLTTIDLSTCESGMYFLRIYKDLKLIRTYKLSIVK